MEASTKIQIRPYVTKTCFSYVTFSDLQVSKHSTPCHKFDIIPILTFSVGEKVNSLAHVIYKVSQSSENQHTCTDSTLVTYSYASTWCFNAL